MTDFSERFERLGLSQYLEAFISEGFDSWETILDITESDLASLDVKLGHRRKLQRAIAESRGQPSDRALNAESRKAQNVDGPYRSEDSGTEPRDGSNRTPHGSIAGGTASTSTGTKRKYRRHPKPDGHAPERPPSAYVIFSNQVREELKGQDLSFTEIAKVVGERWQILPARFREACEQQANSAKEKYYTELAEYKKTPEYAQYQEYLVDFKAKHGPSRTEGKRSKLELETSTLTLTSDGVVASSERSQSISVAPPISAGVPRSSDSSPPEAPQARAAFRRLSSSSSTALYSESVNSPIKPDPQSPRASSPSSSVFATKEHRGPIKAGQLAARLREQNITHNLPHSQTLYSAYWPTDSWPESGSGQASFYTALPRRTSRDTSISHPPALVRQGSTLSSLDSVPNLPPSISLLPFVDDTKSNRILPQPIISTGQRSSPLDHRPQPIPLQGSLGSSSHAGQQQDPQRASNWPALLRATELAREADLNRGAKRKDPQNETP